MFLDKLKNYFKNNIGTIAAFVLGALIFGAPLVRSFTEPASAPPGGNVPAPLNVGDVTQTKAGNLLLNTVGNAKGLIVNGAVDFMNVLNFTNASAAFRRITNLGAPIADADAATKSYVDAQVSGGAGNGCFLSQRTFKGNMGKSSANVACNAEGSGFSFAGKAQWYSRATAGVPVSAWVDGETNNCDNWTSSAAGKNGATIQWDTSVHRWSTPINSACNGYFSLACCNFASADAPMQPTTLQGVNSKEITAALNWNDVSDNETGFKVYKGTTAGFALASAEQVYAVGANATAYNAPQPNNATRYYKVTAYNTKGESDPSNEVGVVTPQGAIAPSGLTFDAPTACTTYNSGYSVSCTSALRWSDNSDIESAFSFWGCGSQNYGNLCYNAPTNYVFKNTSCPANTKGLKVELRWSKADQLAEWGFYYSIASNPSLIMPSVQNWSAGIRPPWLPGGGSFGVQAIPLGSADQCIP